MSSTNKTDNLKLNSWIGSDKPQMVDFNADNSIIDKVISDHMADMVAHITADEREAWTNYLHIGTYFGNGKINRLIETECPFDCRLGLVYASNHTFSVAYFSNTKNCTYFGIFTQQGNTLGVKLAANCRDFAVVQSSSAYMEHEYTNLNESGITYNYIMIR